MSTALRITCRKLSTCSALKQKKVCIVGAGPAGFYAAQHISKHLPDSSVDILEKLPVPFGLVRFGVAPDHPEVKNVINTFTKTAQNDNVNFYGNICLGKDISLHQLRENYHAVLLTYGAEHDNTLGIEGEDCDGVISARKFVGWYNGVPGDENLKIDLSGSSVAVLGQGNVAMDVARILLSPIDLLRKTDITEHALEALSQSRVKNVHLIGRRGPLQAAFTIKELREQLKMPNCETVWRKSDFKDVPEDLSSLQRPRKRITELMLKSLSEQQTQGLKKFLPVFCRSPIKFLKSDSGQLRGIEMTINRLQGDKAEGTEQREILNCDLALRSIGYKSVRADDEINFDFKQGVVKNRNGRVLFKGEDIVDNGLYVAGWLRTGPVGVILTTMSNAFEVGALVCEDFISKAIDDEVKKDGIDGVRSILREKNVRISDWNHWKTIDEYEIKAGEKVGKPREKICSVDKMLEVCNL